MDNTNAYDYKGTSEVSIVVKRDGSEITLPIDVDERGMKELAYLLSSSIKNPAVDFYKKVKAGDFDTLPQGVYDEKVALMETISKLWNHQQTESALLLGARAVMLGVDNILDVMYTDWTKAKYKIGDTVLFTVDTKNYLIGQIEAVLHVNKKVIYRVKYYGDMIETYHVAEAQVATVHDETVTKVQEVHHPWVKNHLAEIEAAYGCNVEHNLFEVFNTEAEAQRSGLWTYCKPVLDKWVCIVG